MADVNVLKDAVLDLKEQAAYYSERQGLELGQRFFDSAGETFKIIATQPLMGRSLDFGRRKLKDVRWQKVRHFAEHLIYYRPVAGGVEVLRVIHGKSDRRNLSSMLQS